MHFKKLFNKTRSLTTVHLLTLISMSLPFGSDTIHFDFIVFHIYVRKELQMDMICTGKNHTRLFLSPSLEPSVVRGKKHGKQIMKSDFGVHFVAQPHQVNGACIWCPTTIQEPSYWCSEIMPCQCNLYDHRKYSKVVWGFIFCKNSVGNTVHDCACKRFHVKQQMLFLLFGFIKLFYIMGWYHTSVLTHLPESQNFYFLSQNFFFLTHPPTHFLSQNFFFLSQNFWSLTHPPTFCHARIYITFFFFFGP